MGLEPWSAPELPPGYGDFLVNPDQPWILPDNVARSAKSRRWQRKQRRAATAMRKASALTGDTVLRVNFPTSAQLAPRWGYGKPPHPEILALLESGRSEYAQVLGAVDSFIEHLEAIPISPTDSVHPAWKQAWLPPLDAALIYTAIRARKPVRVIEVGSGWSTRFAAQAIKDGGLTTELISIDPAPRAEISALGTTTFTQPLETLDLSVFETLERGDVVFIDCSHRVFTNSDVTVFFLEVLPRLAAGVLVGIHDILWPLDYAPGWAGYHFSEQYILGAYLLARAPWLSVAFPAFFAAGCPELLSASKLGAFIAEHELPAWGTSFWLDIEGR